MTSQGRRFTIPKKDHAKEKAMKICIFGASSDALAKEYFDAARRLGELMGRGGHTLIYGGGNDGLMRACADGVKSGGGTAVGVAPRCFDEGDFLQCVFQQWRENESDGEPDNSAACLQSKLNPFRKGVA